MIWSKIKHGNVTLIHHSTSSLVEIEVMSKEEEYQGGPLVDVKNTLYMDYTEFDDLVEAIKTVISIEK